MGKLAGAALAVAAPEAAVATKAAAKATGGGGKDPRATAPGSKAAAQRQAIEDIKARRPAPPAAGHPMVPTSPASPPPASPGGGPSLPSLPMPAAAATGSGFLLGLFAWGAGLAYLNYGAPGVRQFFAAKFLNKKGNLK